MHKKSCLPPNFAMGLALVFVLCRTAVSTAAGAEPTQATAVYAIEPQFRLLRFGEIKPLGWIREQMRRDLGEGFAGHLPEIAPHTAKSDIFGKGRNRPKSLSNPGAGSEQWWNGETEGNWRSGNTMMTLLAGSPAQRATLDARIADLLKNQDPDGYLGIYSPELRWGAGRSGELWTQACLFRGLIAYAEATGNPEVLKAIERATQLTNANYHESSRPLPATWASG